MKKLLGILLIISIGYTISFAKEWTEGQMEESCINGDLQECVNIGTFLEKKGQYEEAVERYSDGCNNGISSGCHNLGRMYKYGQGVTKNIQKYISYYKKACTLGSENSCAALGNYYEFINKNMNKAFKYHYKACNYNLYDQCAATAWFYKKGIGVKQDYKKAVKFYTLACNGNNREACAGLAGLYYTGRGIKKNMNVTKVLFKKACNLGHKKSCEYWNYLEKNNVQ